MFGPVCPLDLLAIGNLLPPANVVCEGCVSTRVCQSFSSQGVGLPQCMRGYNPGADTPARKQTPPQSRPPGSRHSPGADTPPVQSMLGDMVNAQAVRIILECNLVAICYQSSFFNIGIPERKF